MIQPFPRPINPKVKKQTDDQLAKLGQLNQLVNDVNNLNVGGTAYTGIPFYDYPPAILVNEGPKFTYSITEGFPYNNGVVELISYHIKGIRSFNYNNSSGFDEYLCTVSVDQYFGGLFPGSITGMFLSGTNYDIVTSPLAVGGLIEIDNVHVPLTSFNVTFYNYNNNPQPDGKLWYALIIQGNTDATPGYLTGLASYDIELLLPNFVPAPTVFQD
jgi:hypothetical protein